jgi:single-strand selective monofunctional uracil DNA glycosylase
MTLRDISAELARAVRPMTFAQPVTHVYHPLDYAWELHAAYLDRFGQGPCPVLLVGMNPGPWGMAQTGVPFGDPVMVRDWMQLRAEVSRPHPEHPKRPVRGLACPRREVSGTRLWGWAREVFGAPETFFQTFFVHNYCPLSFMEAGGKNLTPDKLPAAERAPLFAHCDHALRQLTAYHRPRFLIGIGAFAEQRIRAALPDFPGTVGNIPHPSPANPAANRNWAAAAEAALQKLGLNY